MRKPRIGVITVSDRCSRGERVDKSGPAVSEAVKSQGWDLIETALVPDENERIGALLCEWSDRVEPLDLILSTGGTGLGARDVTPEATLAVVEKCVPGIPEKMRRDSEKHAMLAALSRAACGVRKRTLILNLPGNPRGAVESLEAVAELVAHALQILWGKEHAHEDAHS
jgi:molybdopterin adenylyltransferase